MLAFACALAHAHVRARAHYNARCAMLAIACAVARARSNRVVFRRLHADVVQPVPRVLYVRRTYTQTLNMT